MAIPVLALRGACECLSVATPSLLCSFLLGNSLAPPLSSDWFLHRVHFLMWLLAHKQVSTDLEQSISVPLASGMGTWRGTISGCQEPHGGCWERAVESESHRWLG